MLSGCIVEEPPKPQTRIIKIINSPFHGWRDFNTYPNPRKVRHGSIGVFHVIFDELHKEVGQFLKMSFTFNDLQSKEDKIRQCNRFVTNREDRDIIYRIIVEYGINGYDFVMKHPYPLN